MKTDIKQERLSLVKALNGVLLAGIVLFGGISAILAVTLAYVSLNQPRTLVPPTLTEPVTVSMMGVDKAYLSQLAEYLIGLKLNVSPETVIRNYGQLLRYVKSDDYPLFEPQFAKEADYIKRNKISSTFFVQAVTVSEDTLSVRLSGQLQQYALGVSLPPEEVTYEITFTYQQGLIAVHNIQKLKKKE